jgi:hypothetical protein
MVRKIGNMSQSNMHVDFQESALTIMHCQHDSGFSLVLVNFTVLPHRLQQRPNAICRRWCFFVVAFKNFLLFVAAAIPSHQAPQTASRIHGHPYSSLIGPSFH